MSEDKRTEFEWPPYITVTDLEIMRDAGIDAREWQDLSRTERADMRREWSQRT